jgi:hypothetical protein
MKFEDIDYEKEIKLSLAKKDCYSLQASCAEMHRNVLEAKRTLVDRQKKLEDVQVRVREAEQILQSLQ